MLILILFIYINGNEYMTDEDLDQDNKNKVIDLDHEDNVIAANTYLKGLVGQVFKVLIGKKMQTSTS